MTTPARPMIPSYGTYLRLDQILNAQNPPDYARLEPGDPPGRRTRERAHHDELLFIVIHQVYELWFKVIIDELRRARDLLDGKSQVSGQSYVREEDIPLIVSALARVNEIQQVLVQQWRVIETMSPTSFLEFRDRIGPASGFQSAQFRELEVLAGLPEELRLDFEGVPYGANLMPDEQARLDALKEEPSLRQVLTDWLCRTPIDEIFPGFAATFLEAFHRYTTEQVELHAKNPNLATSQQTAAMHRIAAQLDAARDYLLGGDARRNHAHQAFLFITSYRKKPLLRWPNALIDSLIEFEQQFRIFRFRHARMVERMIGNRTGTGGSPGVAYLDKTSARYRIFGELLEARNFLIAESRVPPLPDESLLGFRFRKERNE